jgi:hypothetical protein
MGAFYGSIHLRTDDREAVRKILDRVARKQQIRCLLGPAPHGWVGVYPENHGQDERVAPLLAGEFPGDVLYVMVHDDDIFAYTFFRDGQLVDQYNSCPDYFDEVDDAARAECSGRPEVFRHLLPSDEAVRELKELLAADRPVFATETLQRFTEILKLSNAVTSYEYLLDGDTDDIEGWDEFLHVPDQSKARAQKQAAEADLAAKKEQLRADGVLLLEQSVAGQVVIPTWCPDREGSGFLCVGTIPVGRREGAVEHQGPPWSAPLAATGVLVDLSTRVLELSPSGRYLAAGDATGKTRLIDLDRGEQVLEITQPRHVVWVGFTADEQHLITLTFEHGAVTALDGGQRVASFPIASAKDGALHPSGTLVVADEMGKLLFFALPAGQLQKTLRVGGPQKPSPVFAAPPGELALRKIDPAELQEKLQAALQRQLAQTEAMHEKVRAAYRKAGLTEPPDLKERMQEELRKVMEAARPQLERLLGAATPQGQVPAAAFSSMLDQGMERVTALEISADGRWLFYACQNGARVLAWDDVLAATNATPAPKFAAESEPIAIDSGHGLSAGMPMRFTYTLTHDAVAGRLLFGGLEGTVRFLDLTDGSAGVVLDPPGRSPLLRLGLSRDRSALCCTCMPGQFDTGRNRRPPLLQVWNYRRK